VLAVALSPPAGATAGTVWAKTCDAAKVTKVSASIFYLQKEFHFLKFVRTN